MIFEIRHRTTYHYNAAVTESFAELHVLPTDLDGQKVLERSVVIEPDPDHVRQRVDYFGNAAVSVAIREPHTTLSLEAASVVDSSGRPTEFPAGSGDGWEGFTADANPADLAAVEFSLDSPRVVRSAELAAFAEPSFPAGASLEVGVMDLCGRIFNEFAFDPDATEVDTPVSEVLALRRGVCQDFTHLMVGALRSIGLPACYVSGYLETDPPPGQPRLTGADRTHAWVGVYLGGDRWIGVDPTNNQIAGRRYVTTARGRDYSEVSPLRGVIFSDSTRTSLEVAVDVIARDQGVIGVS